MIGIAAMQFLPLLDMLCLIYLKGTSGVDIKTTSPVETTQDTEFVTLQCDYKLESKNASFNMDWFKGKDKVLERHSSGLTEIFMGRVSLNRGCSVVLFRPKVEDSGLYTVRIFAPDEQQNYATGAVKLVVLSNTTTPPVSEDEGSFLPSSEEIRSLLDRYTFIPQFVLSVVGISRIVFLVGFHLFVTRNSAHSMTLGRRRYHYPAIGVILLMFVMGMIFSGIGFRTGSTTYYTGSSTMGILGCLGLFVHDSYLQGKVYKITKQNDVQKTGDGLLQEPKTN